MCFVNQYYIYYYSVKSIDGEDVSKLHQSPFNLTQEMMICNVTLNGMGNSYGEHKYFTEWDFNPAYTNFECALACCIVRMFCQLAKGLRIESNAQAIQRLLK